MFCKLPKILNFFRTSRVKIFGWCHHIWFVEVQRNIFEENFWKILVEIFLREEFRLVFWKCILRVQRNILGKKTFLKTMNSWIRTLNKKNCKRVFSNLHSVCPWERFRSWCSHIWQTTAKKSVHTEVMIFLLYLTLRRKIIMYYYYSQLGCGLYILFFEK